VYLSCPRVSPSILDNRERQSLLVSDDAPFPRLCLTPLTTERKIQNLALSEAGKKQDFECNLISCSGSLGVQLLLHGFLLVLCHVYLPLAGILDTLGASRWLHEGKGIEPSLPV